MMISYIITHSSIPVSNSAAVCCTWIFFFVAQTTSHSTVIRNVKDVCTSTLNTNVLCISDKRGAYCTCEIILHYSYLVRTAVVPGFRLRGTRATIILLATYQ